ncbi:RNA polymerase sigma factor [Blastopirellula retiformator]|uniref:Putative RNA polymerase sigma factor FecI n=1 Tax=Blastopirellula retiformator TaxID=2527970 RepID=A0A5C5VLN1_9BACT|nr:sigma-70 family RNA polymerase sigma factor [Blastopirellula retiformator]TWT38709.1 putative RNA polymerase sigma factor FecI [Blastopirellula retiformator]
MDTSASFLNSLQLVSDDEAWNRLVGLYSPLIRGWLRRFGAAADDVDDVTQEVLTVVFLRLPEFERQPRAGAFRSWLRTIAANCLRDHWRKANRRAPAVGGSEFVQMIDQLEDPHSGVSQLWNREHDQYVIQYLLEEVRSNFTPQTWRAFERFALEGKSADEVSQELGISVNAVFIAKSRVMSCLRKQGAGLLDE